jgi:hypothetical protein
MLHKPTSPCISSFGHLLYVLLLSTHLSFATIGFPNTTSLFALFAHESKSHFSPFTHFKPYIFKSF